MTLDPFDLPPHVTAIPPDPGPPLDPIGPFGAAIEAARDRLRQDQHVRTKALEARVADLTAQLENVSADRDRLQTVLGVHRENPPAVATDSPDAKWHAEHERASALTRELAHLRSLHEHATTSLQSTLGELSRTNVALAELGESLGASEDPAQIRRCLVALQARAAILDDVLDVLLDELSSGAREVLTHDAPDFSKGGARHRFAVELQRFGAGTFLLDPNLVHDTWRWSALGEALRQRRTERLGGRARTGEYKIT